MLCGRVYSVYYFVWLSLGVSVGRASPLWIRKLLVLYLVGSYLRISKIIVCLVVVSYPYDISERHATSVRQHYKRAMTLTQEGQLSVSGFRPLLIQEG